MRRTVAVLAAHPDDAEIAIGGTMAVMSDAGWSVDVLVFTSSEQSEAAAERRRQAASGSARILGFHLSWVRDGSLTQVQELREFEVVRLIDEFVRQKDPSIILSHWVGDSHGDHALLARAALASSRWSSAALYSFAPSDHRSHSYSEFTGNVHIDISEQEERKLQALRLYQYEDAGFRQLAVGEMRCLWRARGAAVGCQAAESLLLLRQVGMPTGLVGTRKTNPAQLLRDP